MKVLDIIKISLANLFRQKVRTLLTVFSIVIGATLISLVYSVIPGFENFFDLQFNTLSSPYLIEVSPIEERPGKVVLSGLGNAPVEYNEEDKNNGSFEFDFGSFTDEDIQKIKYFDGVNDAYEPLMPSIDYVVLEGDTKKYKAGFVFYYPTFILKNMDLVAGNYFNKEDTGRIIISNQFLDSFGIEDADDVIGKKLVLHATQMNINHTNFESQETETSEYKDFEFEVSGVTERTLISSAVYISSKDAIEIVNFVNGNEKALTDEDDSRQELHVELTDPALAEDVKNKIEELGFTATTYEDSKSILNEMFNIITIIFSSFGVLAMAVSSLGILNTLIMAVMERTREIGVMKSIGATRINIAVMFTLEAMFIGLIGGLIGLGLGYGVSEILNIVSHNTFLKSFETLDLSNFTSLILLGPALSTFVATIAGIYPAVKASKLDPVKALRYE